MDKNYVLDTSAIFTYTKEEKGVDTVEDILRAAKKNKCIIYLSFATLMELYYVTWRARNEESAKELIVLIDSLPIQKVQSNEHLTLVAGRIKANHRLSIVDAFIVATALEKKAILVHKDPELKFMNQYGEVLELPYKGLRLKK
ncbi:hypothetical protein MNBD_UNCLBAC01-351 [hydrothermal vent metagenome]|uniref:PIN domain-containing protein n=1 Tax=hydrothermal vent metagenome TaxID=652676 RepID=A0A3B1D539_9ZZZZ